MSYVNLFMVLVLLFFFFFNDTATTEIYTLSLHDALPISGFPAYGSNDIHNSRPVYGLSNGSAHVGARPSTHTAKWGSRWSRCLPGHRPTPQCRACPGVSALRLDREARLYGGSSEWPDSC